MKSVFPARIPAWYTSTICHGCGREGKKGYLVFKDQSEEIYRTDIKFGYLKKSDMEWAWIAGDQTILLSEIRKQGDFATDFGYIAKLQKMDLKFPYQIRQLEGAFSKFDSSRIQIGFIGAKSGSSFFCPYCGTVHDRDINAAFVIRDYSALMFEFYLFGLWVRRMGHHKRSKKIGYHFSRINRILSNAFDYYQSLKEENYLSSGISLEDFEAYPANRSKRNDFMALLDFFAHDLEHDTERHLFGLICPNCRGIGYLENNTVFEMCSSCSGSGILNDKLFDIPTYPLCNLPKTQQLNGFGPIDTGNYIMLALFSGTNIHERLDHFIRYYDTMRSFTISFEEPILKRIFQKPSATFFLPQRPLFYAAFSQYSADLAAAENDSTFTLMNVKDFDRIINRAIPALQASFAEDLREIKGIISKTKNYTANGNFVICEFQRNGVDTKIKMPKETRHRDINTFITMLGIVYDCDKRASTSAPFQWGTNPSLMGYSKADLPSHYFDVMVWLIKTFSSYLSHPDMFQEFQSN